MYYNFHPTFLLSNTYKFKNIYNCNCYQTDYIYDVNFLVLKDFRGKNSIVNSFKFKEFVENECNKKLKKNYDLDINIRDLYPIDIHTNNKDIDDIKRFNNLNEYILLLNSNISRRVTKKEIVYKKNKSKSIITIQISKRKYLKIFLLNAIEEFDIENRFITISKNNCKSLQKLFKVECDNDLIYIKEILLKYIKKILN